MNKKQNLGDPLALTALALEGYEPSSQAIELGARVSAGEMSVEEAIAQLRITFE